MQLQDPQLAFLFPQPPHFFLSLSSSSPQNMDSPTREPPKLKSFTSFLLFGKKREAQLKKPPMHLHNSASLHLEPGLKTLTSPFNHNRSLTCFKPTLLSFSSPSPSPSSTSSSPSPSSSQMDNEKETDKNDNDVNAESEEEEEEATNTHKTHERVCQRIYPHQLSHRWRMRRSSKEREFPPPIPLLARTGNLPCHMPWVMRRIRDNGRLVIQEVLVKHHEFFRTHRANGRLTLQLMHLDESVLFNRIPPITPLHLQSEDENENKDPTPDDLNEEQEREREARQEEVSIPKDSQENNPSSSPTASKEKSIEDYNPSSKPLHQSLSLPSMSDGNLKTPRANLDNGPLVPLQEKNMPDLSSQMGSLQCILPSSLPESSLGIGGNGGGSCFASGRSNTLFQMPAPTIRPIHG